MHALFVPWYNFAKVEALKNKTPAMAIRVE
jgi:hypothetical protein